MTSSVRRYRGPESSFWPGRSEEMMLTVSQPAEHLVQRGELAGRWGGHISPIRTATRSCIRRSSGAIPAAKPTESMPIV